jgi:hypothetical protein
MQVPSRPVAVKPGDLKPIDYEPKDLNDLSYSYLLISSQSVERRLAARSYDKTIQQAPQALSQTELEMLGKYSKEEAKIRERRTGKKDQSSIPIELRPPEKLEEETAMPVSIPQLAQEDKSLFAKLKNSFAKKPSQQKAAAAPQAAKLQVISVPEQAELPPKVQSPQPASQALPAEAPYSQEPWQEITKPSQRIFAPQIPPSPAAKPTASSISIPNETLPASIATLSSEPTTAPAPVIAKPAPKQFEPEPYSAPKARALEDELEIPKPSLAKSRFKPEPAIAPSALVSSQEPEAAPVAKQPLAQTDSRTVPSSLPWLTQSRTAPSQPPSKSASASPWLPRTPAKKPAQKKAQPPPVSQEEQEPPAPKVVPKPVRAAAAKNQVETYSPVQRMKLETDEPPAPKRTLQTPEPADAIAQEEAPATQPTSKSEEFYWGDEDKPAPKAAPEKKRLFDVPESIAKTKPQIVDEIEELVAPKEALAPEPLSLKPKGAQPPGIVKPLNAASLGGEDDTQVLGYARQYMPWLIEIYNMKGVSLDDLRKQVKAHMGRGGVEQESTSPQMDVPSQGPSSGSAFSELEDNIKKFRKK